MAAHQFRDLPQIPQATGESRCAPWELDPYSYMNAYKQENVNFQLEDDMYFGDFDNGAVSMQPMQRFMQDQYPLAQGLLYANIPVGRELCMQYESQRPSTDSYRYISPDPTSASDKSSCAPFSDLRSSHVYQADPYNSPTDNYLPLSLPCPTTELLRESGYLSFSSLPGGNIENISLRDIELEHPESEHEATMEETETVALKPESAPDCETIVVETKPTTTDDSRDYPDSGIGNSVRDAESVQPIDVQDLPEDTASDSDYSPTASSRSSKRRRSSASNSSPTRISRRTGSSVSKSANSSKVSKRNRRTSSTVKKHMLVDECRRPFPCPLASYGCSSAFSSKNEWKRHVSTQHIKLSFWRCDLCPPSADSKDDQAVYYNDFNRKDLFTQHLRRMHAAPKEGSARLQKGFPVKDENLPEHQDRCLMRLRKAPQHSKCLFCEKTFEGPTSWEERMEHIGRHLEKDGKGNIDMLDIKSWNVDEGLEQYLMDEGLIVKEHGGWKIGKGKPVRVECDSEDDSEEE